MNGDELTAALNQAHDNDPQVLKKKLDAARAEIERLINLQLKPIDEAIAEMECFNRYNYPTKSWVITMLRSIRYRYATGKELKT